MRALLLAVLALALPASAQDRAADYQQLMRAYQDAFRVLGRSRVCGLNFDVEPHFREVAKRHGEGSEPVRIAGLAYQEAVQDLVVAPMPCDVVIYMRGMRLPEMPASLRRE